MTKETLNKSYTSKNPFKRVANAFKYSMQGLSSAFKTEQAFRQDLLLVAIHSIAAYFLVPTYWVLALFWICGIAVLIAELINTAIEYIVDRIGPEHHELSGKAKDVGSAIVLLAILNLVILWIGFFIQMKEIRSLF